VAAVHWRLDPGFDMIHRGHRGQQVMFSGLQGKVVLVTGASTGIGAAVARGFGRAGAKVGVHFNRSREDAERVAGEVRASGGEALTLQGDVTRAADLERIIAETVAAFGRIDVLVNNAGDVVQRTPFVALSGEVVDRIIALNARSVVEACRLVLPQLRRGGGGNIINTTSIAARQSGGPGSSIYAAAKGFVQSLTRSLAREHARDGIRVNAVAPGLIATPLHDRLTTPEQLQAMAANVPMGRIGQPEDCVGAFLFLADDTLAGFVTGQTIDVNGGQYLS
jgi:3-oxoacyl-[acyl-carrier protein] reductase